MELGNVARGNRQTYSKEFLMENTYRKWSIQPKNSLPSNRVGSGTPSRKVGESRSMNPCKPSVFTTDSLRELICPMVRPVSARLQSSALFSTVIKLEKLTTLSVCKLSLSTSGKLIDWVRSRTEKAEGHSAAVKEGGAMNI